MASPVPPAEISWPTPCKVHHGAKHLEISCQKSHSRASLTDSEVQSRRVIEALWRAFPEATSDNDLADRASPYFRNKRGEPVEPRTIRYWLRGETLPGYLHTITLIGMVGVGFFNLPDRGTRE